MFLFAPVTSALCERVGCRVVAFCGGLLGVLGFVLSSFVKDVYRLYVTFGVLWGVGASMSYLPTLRSLPYWFERQVASWESFCNFVLFVSLPFVSLPLCFKINIFLLVLFLQANRSCKRYRNGREWRGHDSHGSPHAACSQLFRMVPRSEGVWRHIEFVHHWVPTVQSAQSNG